MADFMPVTACNDPKITDHIAVEQIIRSYYFDPYLNLGVGFDRENGDPYLFLCGDVWPESWRLPEGVDPALFDPFATDLYEEGADGFVAFLKEIAPCLAEPLTVHAIGSEKF